MGRPTRSATGRSSARAGRYRRTRGEGVQLQEGARLERQGPRHRVHGLRRGRGRRAAEGRTDGGPPQARELGERRLREALGDPRCLQARAQFGQRDGRFLESLRAHAVRPVLVVPTVHRCSSSSGRTPPNTALPILGCTASRRETSTTASKGTTTVSDHSALLLLACALTVLVAALTGAAAGYLARRDHATYPAMCIRDSLLTATVASALTHR